MISFNQKIQWSMRKRRIPLKNVCADKLKVKDYVNEKLGDGFVPRTFIVAKDINELLEKAKAFKDHPRTCLIKANNDSGGVALVKDGVVNLDQLNIVEKFKSSVYEGFYRGEWFYAGIEYKCFTEEYLGDNLTDYKFHCSAGEPRFCQVIRDRHIDANEVCTDMDGNCHSFHLYPPFKLVKEFKKPKNWERMKEIAKILCEPFDYVRVDMYNINIEDFTDKSLFIGEHTFAPLSGAYEGSGQIEAGKLLVNMIKTKVLVDCGSGLGKEYEEIKKLEEIDSSWDVVMFEPNFERVEILKTKYSEDNIVINNKVVSAFIGEKRYLPAQVLPETVMADTIDLSDFINTLDHDYICLKIDVKGLEYDLLKKIIKTQSIKKLDIVYIVFYSYTTDLNVRRKNEQLASSILNFLNKSNIPFVAYLANA